MKLIKKSILFLVAAASLAGGRAYAQRPLIDVAIDSAAILIGEQTTLHLTVTADKDRPVQIVIPNDTLMTGVEVLNLRKHDMVAIQVYDRRETELPAVGLMKIKDAETGKEQWIDSSSARVRAAYKEWWEKRQAKMSDTFKKCRVDSVSVRTEDDYVKALIALFDKRN